MTMTMISGQLLYGHTKSILSRSKYIISRQISSSNYIVVGDSETFSKILKADGKKVVYFTGKE